MPTHDKTVDEPKKGRVIKSAFDSESFEADGTIHVDGLVGSATISPSGRDIALASYVRYLTSSYTLLIVQALTVSQ